MSSEIIVHRNEQLCLAVWSELLRLSRKLFKRIKHKNDFMGISQRTLQQSESSWQILNLFRINWKPSLLTSLIINSIECSRDFGIYEFFNVLRNLLWKPNLRFELGLPL